MSFDFVLVPLHFQCPTNGRGRVEGEDWETILSLWISRWADKEVKVSVEFEVY